MINEDQMSKQIEEWSKNYDPKKIERIDNKYVHKVNDENNLVSRIIQISKGDTDSYLSQFIIDNSHPYFFEHPYDHIPGMMMVEAARQVGSAIAHLYYDVSFETVFILNEMNVRFFRYVVLTLPLFIKSQVRNKLTRRGKLMQMEIDGYLVQDGKEVAFMSGTWQMYDKKIIQRFRRSSANINLSE